MTGNKKRNTSFRLVRLIELVLLFCMIITFLVFMIRPFPKNSPYYSQYYSTGLVAITYLTLGGLTLVCLIDLACQFSSEPISSKPMCLYCVVGFIFLIAMGIMSINQYNQKINLEPYNTTHHGPKIWNSSMTSLPGAKAMPWQHTNITNATLINVVERSLNGGLIEGDLVNSIKNSSDGTGTSTQQSGTAAKQGSAHLDGDFAKKPDGRMSEKNSAEDESYRQNITRNSERVFKRPGILLFLGISAIITSFVYLVDALIYIHEFSNGVINWHSRVYPYPHHEGGSVTPHDPSEKSTMVTTGDAGIQRKITQSKLHEIETLYRNRESNRERYSELFGPTRTFSYNNHTALDAMNDKRNAYYESTATQRYYPGDAIEEMIYVPAFDMNLIGDRGEKRPEARQTPFQSLRNETANKKDVGATPGNILNEMFVKDFGKQINVYAAHETSYASLTPDSSSSFAVSTLSAAERKKLKKAQKRALKVQKKAEETERKRLKKEAKALKSGKKVKKVKAKKIKTRKGKRMEVGADPGELLADETKKPPLDINEAPRVCCGSKWRRKSRRHISSKKKRGKKVQSLSTSTLASSTDDDVYRKTIPLAKPPRGVLSTEKLLFSGTLPNADKFCHCKQPSVGKQLPISADQMCCMCDRKIQRLREQHTMLQVDRELSRSGLQNKSRSNTLNTEIMIPRSNFMSRENIETVTGSSPHIAPAAVTHHSDCICDECMCVDTQKGTCVSPDNLRAGLVGARIESQPMLIARSAQRQQSQQRIYKEPVTDSGLQKTHHADCICDECMCVDTQKGTCVSPGNLRAGLVGARLESQPMLIARSGHRQQSQQRIYKEPVTVSGVQKTHHADCICDECMCVDVLPKLSQKQLRTVYARPPAPPSLAPPEKHPANCPCARCTCDTDDLIVTPSITVLDKDQQRTVNVAVHRGTRDFGVMVDTCRCCDCIKPQVQEQLVVQERVDPVKINIVKEREHICYCKVVIKPTPSVPRVEVARIAINKAARKTVDVREEPVAVFVPSVRRTIWERRTVTRTAVKSECGLARRDTDALLQNMELRCVCGRKPLPPPEEADVERGQAMPQEMSSLQKDRPCHCCTCNDRDQKQVAHSDDLLLDGGGGGHRDGSQRNVSGNSRTMFHPLGVYTDTILDANSNYDNGSALNNSVHSSRRSMQETSAANRSQNNIPGSSRIRVGDFSHTGNGSPIRDASAVRLLSPLRQSQHAGSTLNVAFAQPQSLHSVVGGETPLADTVALSSGASQLSVVGEVEDPCDPGCAAACGSDGANLTMTVHNLGESELTTSSSINATGEQECPCQPNEVVQIQVTDDIIESHPVAAGISDYPIVSSTAQLRTPSARRVGSTASRRISKPASSTSPKKQRRSTTSEGKANFSSYGGTFHVSKDVAPISCSPPPIPHYHMHDICCQPIQEAPPSGSCNCPPPVALCPLGHAHNIGAMAAAPRADGGQTRNFFIYPVSVERSEVHDSVGDSLSVGASEKWVIMPDSLARPRPLLESPSLSVAPDDAERSTSQLERLRRDQEEKERFAIPLEIDASNLMIPQVGEVLDVQEASSLQVTNWCMAQTSL